MDLYIISLVNSLFFLDFLINSSLFLDKLLQSLAPANGWKGISHNLSSVVLSGIITVISENWCRFSEANRVLWLFSPLFYVNYFGRLRLKCVWLNCGPDSKIIFCKSYYSEKPRVRTYSFKNLLAEICLFINQNYKNLFIQARTIFLSIETF